MHHQHACVAMFVAFEEQVFLKTIFWLLLGYLFAQLSPWNTYSQLSVFLVSALGCDVLYCAVLCFVVGVTLSARTASRSMPDETAPLHSDVAVKCIFCLKTRDAVYPLGGRYGCECFVVQVASRGWV